jgi:hypothetical protein
MRALWIEIKDFPSAQIPKIDDQSLFWAYESAPKSGRFIIERGRHTFYLWEDELKNPWIKILMELKWIHN